MIYLKAFFLSTVVFASPFFQNLSGLTYEKKTRLLEKRIDFICSRGIDVQMRETLKAYYNTKKNFDEKSVKLLKKCLSSKNKKVLRPFFDVTFDKNNRNFFWMLFPQLRSMTSEYGQERFRGFLLATLNADDAYYFLKYKKDIHAIFSAEAKDHNNYSLIFKKSVFWGFDNIAQMILKSADHEFRKDKFNNFWECIFLKNQKKLDQSQACFKKSDIGLSKTYEFLTAYLKSKKYIDYSVIANEVSKIRDSSLPVQLKLVNEAVVAIITGSKNHLDKSVMAEYLSLESKSIWYDYIALSLTSKSNRLTMDQRKNLLENLKQSRAGMFFLGLLESPVQIQGKSFFQDYSYQALLVQMSK